MTTFEIIIVSFLAWFALLSVGMFAFKILNQKALNKAKLVKAHRELISFYIGHKEILDPLFNNEKVISDVLTKEQKLYCNMVFNYFELVVVMKTYDLVPKRNNFRNEIRGLLSNKLIKIHWDDMKTKRDPKFIAKIEKVLK